MYICDNITRDGEGRLLFAGQDVTALAGQYGTPVYLMDEARIRHNCRTVSSAVRESFGDAARVLYAGKAASFGYIYKLMTGEGMGIDVVSTGEIFTAERAGFDMSNAFFHGNGKAGRDIAYAMDRGVGYFVADSEGELLALSAEAERRGIKQRILLRITPGIDPHTYEAVATGKVDSKFGAAVETGDALRLTRLALSLGGIELRGFHCHVGSQVFTEDVFERSAAVMISFMADVRDTCGYTAEMLDLGGGFGVRYTEKDPPVDIPGRIASIASAVRSACGENSLPVPFMLFEPGRSIVADAGMTLYTVCDVKRIEGYKTYVAVDGGMGDDPRYALYGSAYTCLAAREGSGEMMTCDLVGRYCESGDILQPGIELPADIKRGDVVAVCTTGAYNYSMASNYNRVPRPPVVMLREEGNLTAVRRETEEDVADLDM